MNSIETQTIAFLLAANGAKRPECFYELGSAQLLDPEYTPNPCEECQGRGELETSSGSFDPDADIYTDDCEKCSGSGNANCPACDNPAPLLVRVDGRCHGCILQAALEMAEAEE